MANTYNPELISLLKCVTCGHPLIREDETSLLCKDCGTRYVIENGIPIMLGTENISTDLQYDKSPRGITHPEGKFRRWLRSINIEACLRRLWTTYQSLSSRIEPGSPAEPAYWMDKIKAILPAGPKKVLDFSTTVS